MEKGEKKSTSYVEGKREKEILEFTVRPQKGQEQIANTGHHIKSLCANKIAMKNKPGGTRCLIAKKVRDLTSTRETFLDFTQLKY